MASRSGARSTAGSEEHGAWASVALAFEERGPTGAWQPARLALIRLQRVRDAWKKHATITFASRSDDAMRLPAALVDWFLHGDHCRFR
jgi:hypothetical protein